MSVSGTKQISTYDEIIANFTSRSAFDGEEYQKNLTSMNTMLGDCAVQINFWGTRHIVASEDTTCVLTPVALDTLAQRILRASTLDVSAHFKMKNIRGSLLQKLRNYYQISDAQIHSSILTRFFELVRTTLPFLFAPSPRHLIEERFKKPVPLPV